MYFPYTPAPLLGLCGYKKVRKHYASVLFYFVSGTSFSTSCGSNINNTAFTRNGIALQIARIPGERAGLILERCAFWGNEADIENPNDYPVELRNSSGIG